MKATLRPSGVNVGDRQIFTSCSIVLHASVVPPLHARRPSSSRTRRYSHGRDGHRHDRRPIGVPHSRYMGKFPLPSGARVPDSAFTVHASRHDGRGVDKSYVMHTGVGPISHEFSSVLGGVLAEGQFGEHRLSLTALVRDAARRNLAQKQVSSVLLSLAPLHRQGLFFTNSGACWF